jgi:hypothetical protein
MRVEHLVFDVGADAAGVDDRLKVFDLPPDSVGLDVRAVAQKCAAKPAAAVGEAGRSQRRAPGLEHGL